MGVPEPAPTEASDMIKTHGLTHLSLDVADPDASLRFYRDLFGVKEYFRDADSIQVQGPGAHDVMAFVRSAAAGKPAGINHFGFRLTDPTDIDAAVATAERAGGRIIERGEFAPGLPFVYVADPDGYVIEIWYE
jgi:catechol 2,3-dioxygenase-like lactoylglutathione lyase family enzyme